MNRSKIDSPEFSDNTVKQLCNVIPELLMFQYMIFATRGRVKMEEIALISTVDTTAPARMVILETTVIVSIII